MSAERPDAAAGGASTDDFDVFIRWGEQEVAAGESANGSTVTAGAHASNGSAAGGTALARLDDTSTALDAVPAGPNELAQGDLVEGDLESAIAKLRDDLTTVRLPLPAPGVASATDSLTELVDQLDDYVLPRLRDLKAPLLAVVGGSTGSGKSTIVNSLIGRDVSPASALRPTTRQPVLVHAPSDREWFVNDRILPRLPRITGPGAIAPEPSSVFGLRLIESDAIGSGMAVIDAPDLDSVSRGNRELSATLLAAADLWIFVTSAARYHDAVPWQALHQAVARNAAVVIVLNRVPPEAIEEIPSHLRASLAEHGLAEAPVYVLPETQLVNGHIPPSQLAPLADFVESVVGDAATREAVVRQTLAGVLGQTIERTNAIADACAAQGAAVRRLEEAADIAFRQAAETVSHSVTDGSMMRGEVLLRWQEFVGASQWMQKLESSVGQLRDRLSASLRGRPSSPDRVEQALESALATVITDATHRACRQTDDTWRADPAGRAALGNRDMSQPPQDLGYRVEATVRAWQSDVLQMIQAEGADKRQSARFMAYGVNAVALTAMVMVFATTGGLTGAEVGIAGAASVLAQKVLEAVFGEDAVRRLATSAVTALDQRVDELMTEERARFEALLAGLVPEANVADQLYGDAANVHKLVVAENLDVAGTTPLGPGSQPKVIEAAAVTAGAAYPGQELEPVPARQPQPARRWRDAIKSWWEDL